MLINSNFFLLHVILKAKAFMENIMP